MTDPINVIDSPKHTCEARDYTGEVSEFSLFLSLI